MGEGERGGQRVALFTVGSPVRRRRVVHKSDILSSDPLESPPVDLTRVYSGEKIVSGIDTIHEPQQSQQGRLARPTLAKQRVGLTRLKRKIQRRKDLGSAGKRLAYLFESD